MLGDFDRFFLEFFCFFIILRDFLQSKGRKGKFWEWTDEEVAWVDDDTLDFDDLLRRSLRDDVELCVYYAIR